MKSMVDHQAMEGTLAGWNRSSPLPLVYLESPFSSKAFPCDSHGLLSPRRRIHASSKIHCCTDLPTRQVAFGSTKLSFGNPSTWNICHVLIWKLINQRWEQAHITCDDLRQLSPCSHHMWEQKCHFLRKPYSLRPPFETSDFGKI